MQFGTEIYTAVDKFMLMYKYIKSRQVIEQTGKQTDRDERKVLMPYRIRARAPTETPIERIFEKVMRRKMTSQERIYFHLKRIIKPPRRLNANGQSRAA